MSARLSGSSIGRAERCPAAFALPSAQRDSEEASRGREVHAHMERLALGVPAEESLTQVSGDARLICDGLTRDIIPAGGRPEVAYAYDVVTGRAREIVAEGRDYRVWHTEIPGRIDLVARSDDRGLVVDWKSTAWAIDLKAIEPQLDFYALCVARAHGLQEVECCVCVLSESTVAWHRRTLDWEALAVVARRVREAWQGVELERAARAEHERVNAAAWVPDVTVGVHCQYCPAWEQCPAKRALITAVDVEVGGDAYLRAQDLTKWSEAIRNAVGERVSAVGPLPTSDGRVVRRDGRGSLRVFRAA